MCRLRRCLGSRQLCRSGDMFSISLGNFPAGKEVEIHLQLVGELWIDAEGSVRISLPSSLKPKYGPAGSGCSWGWGSRTGGPKYLLCTAHTQLTVLNAQEIAEVTSPTHALTTTQRKWRSHLLIPSIEMLLFSSNTEIVTLPEDWWRHSFKQQANSWLT